MSVQPPISAKNALVSVLISYVAWGTFGLYFKALDHVSPFEILSHRILWSCILLIVLVSFLKQWHKVFFHLKQGKNILLFLTTACLITINWAVYIYAVVNERALEGSMGYFIMPLVAIMLGAIFFKERFNKAQFLAILLALSGVVYQIIAYGTVPWIALTLAFSFGVYGMLRKKSSVDALVGLFLETAILSPFVLIYLGYLESSETLYITAAPILEIAMLMMAGPITALPLMLFAKGARGLRYSTVGLLQYINPSCQFLLAIYIFKEPFQSHDLIIFAFIWSGLIIYSLSSWQQSRRTKKAVA